jgi:hypothetical protein
VLSDENPGQALNSKQKNWGKICIKHSVNEQDIANTSPMLIQAQLCLLVWFQLVRKLNLPGSAANKHILHCMQHMHAITADNKLV